ncbi:right-handed parallel beta-helix repeat-containing protein [Methylocystis heyeri]|uniref:Right handed beta helix domain-containing protein n=1 Tax=Methylocystis heyeri TaxID=391905 RepID=A0A6B8KD54_9HYPH|nr:right-handed parallel beta-helix repeat-containing protein [Methylocystis heyeri]QGM45639.1 hypothetical protein H2LOC_007950 [Methylocystis heyeri]
MLKNYFVAALIVVPLNGTARASGSIAVWVSGSGADAPGCGSLTAPCRHFQYAHDNALGPDGGDILIHDSASYGPLTITKSVSVINDGVGTAGTGAASGQIAIAINAPQANVTLRGLSIDGVGGAYGGVNAYTVGSLTIKNCFIQNFTQYGINFTGNFNAVKYLISDTVIQNNGVAGITMNSFPNVLQGNISNVKLFNNGIGLQIAIIAYGESFQAMVSDTIFSGNGTGLSVSGPGALAALRRSIITWNNTGYNISGSAIVQTYQDNTVNGNAGNVGSLTTVGNN